MWSFWSSVHFCNIICFDLYITREFSLDYIRKLLNFKLLYLYVFVLYRHFIDYALSKAIVSLAISIALLLYKIWIYLFCYHIYTNIKVIFQLVGLLLFYCHFVLSSVCIYKVIMSLQILGSLFYLFLMYIYMYYELFISLFCYLIFYTRNNFKK